MGLLEILLFLPSLVPLGVGVWLLGRSPTVRAPLPWLALLACGLGVLAAGVAGLAMGPVLYGSLSMPGLVFGFGPTVVRAERTCSVFLAGGMALPFLAAAGSIALSENRSWARGLETGAAVGLGFPAGAALFYAALGDPARELFEASGSVEHAAFVEALVRALGACGVAGAVLLAVPTVAGRSREALRRAAQATLALPSLALGVGALASPPDPVSQVLLALPIAVAWGLGLALGAAIASWRDPR
ncbi:MAG: hypothetical protein H6737_23735 [Alphaproteobacteria bacterium]|nr:hypothetical protein [Alphaproteobacteria bacterium]